MANHCDQLELDKLSEPTYLPKAWFSSLKRASRRYTAVVIAITWYVTQKYKNMRLQVSPWFEENEA
jgi:hypothetical protein